MKTERPNDKIYLNNVMQSMSEKKIHFFETA